MILINKSERSKYPYASITEAFKHVVNMDHNYNESLVDYSKSLKQGKYILEVHVSKDVLGYYVENIYEIKKTIWAENKKKIKSEEFNKWVVYLFIYNSDQLKYTSLTNGLASQYSMKNHQYPKDIISTADTMKNHQHDDSGMRKTDHKTSKHEGLNKPNMR